MEAAPYWKVILKDKDKEWMHFLMNFFFDRRSWWKKQSHRKICLSSRSLLKKGEVVICKSEKSDVSLSRVEVTRHVLVRYNLNTVLSFIGGNMGLWLGVGTLQVRAADD